MEDRACWMNSLPDRPEIRLSQGKDEECPRCGLDYPKAELDHYSGLCEVCYNEENRELEPNEEVEDGTDKKV